MASVVVDEASGEAEIELAEFHTEASDGPGPGTDPEAPASSSDAAPAPGAVEATP